MGATYAQPISDSARQAYLEKVTYEMALRGITDSIEFEGHYRSSDYEVFAEDTLLILSSRNDRILLSNKWSEASFFGSLYKGEKDGYWIYLLANQSFIIERWKKGVIQSRRVFTPHKIK